jgi:cell division transport system ATP-binding protein
VPSSTASDGATVGSGPESADPEQPAPSRATSNVATTASVVLATRGRRTGDMHGSLGGAGFLEPWASSSNLDPVIRFEKVSKTYPGQGHSALDNVSIDVEKGEFVFLVGASGSGKSTALRLVLRESRPTAGRVYVAGKEINRLASWKVPRLRRQIGTVFQDFRLLPNKTVNENVAFALQVIGKSRSEITKVVPETLELVGLEGKGDRMPDELSGGEQQRVAIARAFVNRPMILIADEPTGNLDPATSVGIMKLLDRINRTGTTVVMATHDHGVVDQMRKRVVELSAGQVVRDQAQGGYGFSH